MLRFLLVFLLVAPSALIAAVKVKSGEHADFSRLVLQFDASPTWVFGRVEGGYELRVDVVGVEIDTSRIFALIPKTRITDVHISSPGRVFIAVDCNCHGDAFEIRKGRLVIDIKDGGPSKNSAFEKELPSVTHSNPVIVKPKIMSASHPVDQMKSSDIPIEISPETNDHTTEVRPPIPGLSNAFQEWKYTNIEETEASLLKQLSLAAAGGMIVAKDILPKPKPVTPVKAEHNVAKKTEPPSVHDTLPKHSNGVPHMRIETAVDRGMSAIPPEKQLSVDGDTCLTSELFSIESLDKMEMGGGLLNGLRMDLLQEFDVPNPEAVKKLAKTYLYHGFGAETLTLLDTINVDFPEAATMRLLAEIMDNGFTKNPGLLMKQGECATDVAMWAVLAKPRGSTMAGVETNAVLQTFSNLPVHLRKHLGPPLAQRFLEADKVAAATMIRNIIARETEPHDTGFNLLQSQLHADRDQSQVAVEMLKATVQDGGPQTAQAVISLLETELDGGHPVDKTTAELAQALAYEHRGSELGQELAEVTIRGLIASGEIAQAFSSIRAAVASKDISEEQEKTLLAKAHLVNVEVSENITFLRLVHKYLPENADTAELRMAMQEVAKRLAKLGFHKKATEIIDTEKLLSEAKDHAHMAMNTQPHVAGLKSEFTIQPDEPYPSLEAGALLLEQSSTARAMIDDIFAQTK